MMLKRGKINMIIDGQFGSTGKGLFAQYLANMNMIDLCITNAGPNSGHTFYMGTKRCVARMLPVAGIVSPNALIYFCAGSVINTNILKAEIKEFRIDTDRIAIHPRACVINSGDINNERAGRGQHTMEAISSTQSGVGSAIARKVGRSAFTAMLDDYLFDFITNTPIENNVKGRICLMEVPQGLGLGLNSGLSYPQCTSRDITVSSALSDLGIHPDYLGNVCATMRTYPIRVGNGEGDSGPFYPDGKETTWEEIGQEPEYTTNTNKIRRVAKFSMQQYKYMLMKLRPDYVFMNFMNYLTEGEQKDMLKLREITHAGYYKYASSVYEVGRI